MISECEIAGLIANGGSIKKYGDIEVLYHWPRSIHSVPYNAHHQEFPILEENLKSHNIPALIIMHDLGMQIVFKDVHDLHFYRIAGLVNETPYITFHELEPRVASY